MMIYYKVKKDFYAITAKKTKYYLKKGELKTFNEIFKIGFNKSIFENLEEVELTKKQIFWFFGYRLQKEAPRC